MATHLQNFDDNFLVGRPDVHTLEDLTVFAATELPHQLVIVLIPREEIS